MPAVVRERLRAGLFFLAAAGCALAVLCEAHVASLGLFGVAFSLSTEAP